MFRLLALIFLMTAIPTTCLNAGVLKELFKALSKLSKAGLSFDQGARVGHVSIKPVRAANGMGRVLEKTEHPLPSQMKAEGTRTTVDALMLCSQKDDNGRYSCVSDCVK